MQKRYEEEYAVFLNIF